MFVSLCASLNLRIRTAPILSSNNLEKSHFKSLHSCDCRAQPFFPSAQSSTRPLSTNTSNLDTTVTVPSGLCAIYKPKGWTSSGVVSKIKYTLEKEAKRRIGRKVKLKVGHGGTLDPMAEGVLVLGIGHGTKLLGQYLAGPKGYIAHAKLGLATDSLDSTGKVVEARDCSHISSRALQEALPSFRGDIQQVPPMYSALKRDGKRLYELAREGTVVEREPRAVTVYRLELIDYSGLDDPIELSGVSTVTDELVAAHENDSSPRRAWGPGPPDGESTSPAQVGSKGSTFGLEIECSGGFYVRSLIADVAERCGGVAHMTALTRSKQGAFSPEHCLREDGWIFDSLCEHTLRCSQLAGLRTEDMLPAVRSSHM